MFQIKVTEISETYIYGISLPEKLTASQEGLCYMELVNWLVGWLVGLVS
jgi:hypothetical protein